MRLVIYELKKLGGITYLWTTLAVMAIALAGLLAYRSDAFSYDRELDREARRIYREYTKDPSLFQNAKEEYDNYVDKFYEFYNSLDPNATDEEIEQAYRDTFGDYQYVDKLGAHRKNGEPISDEEIYGIWPEVDDERPLEFAKEMSEAADARMRLYALWLGEDAPVYGYQSHMKEAYSRLLEKEPYSAESPGLGWAQYFHFEDTGLFIYVYLILFSGTVFLVERSCGTLEVMRTTKKGRIKTVLSKLAALVIVDIAVVAVFTLASYLIFAFTFGCGGGGLPISAVKYTVPLDITVVECALLQFAMRCVCAVAFSLVTAAIAALTLSPVAAYAAGAALLVANVIGNYYLSYSWLTRINMLNMTTFDLLEYFDETLFLGSFRPTFAVGMAVWGTVAAAAFAVAAVTGSIRSAAVFSPAKRLSAYVRRKRQERAA